MTPPKLQSRKKPALYFKVGLAIIALCTLSCTKTTYVAKGTTDYYNVADARGNVDMNALIAPYHDQMEAKMGQVIGSCDETISAAKPEGALGNWVADLLFEYANANSGFHVDFAFQNSGGLRIPELPAGPITVGKIYELMPFDNLLVILEMQGIELRQLFDHMAEGDGWPISASVRYVIAGDHAENITIGGKPIEDTRVYRFALPDFIANGGDNCDFLENVTRHETGALIRDIILQKTMNLNAAGLAISAVTDGRVSISKDDKSERK